MRLAPTHAMNAGVAKKSKHEHPKQVRSDLERKRV
jgi:hypothetical protein